MYWQTLSDAHSVGSILSRDQGCRGIQADHLSVQPLQRIIIISVESLTMTILVLAAFLLSLCQGTHCLFSPRRKCALTVLRLSQHSILPLMGVYMVMKPSTLTVRSEEHCPMRRMGMHQKEVTARQPDRLFEALKTYRQMKRHG